MQNVTNDDLKKLAEMYSNNDAFKAGMQSYQIDVRDQNGNLTKVKQESHSAQFIYRPPEHSEPLMQNVELGYKFATQHRERCGKRFIKIKRFGKTRRYYVSKFHMTSALILNDNWISNLWNEK